MKQKRGIILAILSVMLSILMLMLASCDDMSAKDGFGVFEAGVKSIEKIVSKDGVDTYEITFSDDTTRTIKIISNEGEAINVSGATVNETGELVLTLSNGTQINAGNVIGPKGDKGDQGDKGDKGDKGDQGVRGNKGDTGVGIAEIEIVDGELIVTYTDNTNANLGNVIGPQGPQGNTGNGIKSIEKIKTEGLVDTYKITFTDETCFEYIVTNGATGSQGQVGATGATGNGIKSVEKIKTEGLVDTYRVTFTDETYFEYTITNGAVGIQGPQGETGATGPQGPQGETGAQGPQGETGPQGPQGEVGKDGIGIKEVKIVDNEMVVVYTDNTEENLGIITSTDWKTVYEAYKASNPDYTKSQIEWMAEIVEKALYIPEYTVTFNSNGGSEVSSQTVKKGDKVALPQAPEKYGYEFLGWYVGEEKWSFIGYTVTEDITLEAKWNEIPVSILYGSPIYGSGEIGGMKYSKTGLVYSPTMKDYRTHNGVDIEAPLGTQILAVASGTITEIKEDQFMGMCITIKHSDLIYSHYKGLDPTLPLEITVGKELNKGDVIAFLGNSAMNEIAQPPHLHYELEICGEKVDPSENMDFCSHYIHNYIDVTGSVVKEPDCINPGIMRYNCYVCGIQKEEEFGNPTGTHKFSDGVCVDCGLNIGTEINVLVTRYASTAGAPWGQMELNPASFGEAINQAHIDRQAMIFDTYGVTVNYVEARDNQNVASDIITAMTSKDVTYEIAYPRVVEGQSLVSYLYDMNQSLYLDFTQPYFNQSAYEAFTVCDRTLFAAGDMDFMDNQTVYMLFFNKDMLEDLQEDLSEQLYTEVKNGTWTYDMLKNLSKQVKGNIGDPEQGDEDIYGYGTNNVARFFAYAGIKEADVDPDTGMYRIALDLDMEKVDTVIANIIECKTGTDWARTNWGGQWGSNLVSAFTEGRVLFYEDVANQINNVGSIDFALGVVPFPKLNEEQENYTLPVTNAQTTLVCIPKCTSNRVASEILLNALAKTGSETIMEAYYEKFEAKFDLETAEEDMEIVKDYIMANIMYDAGELTCGWAGFLSSVKTGSYANNTNNFTQVFGEAQEQAEITIGSWNDAWGSYNEETE